MNDFNIGDKRHDGSTDSGSPMRGAKEERKQKNYNDDPTNLIVNYLPVYFTEDHLRELFSQYGHIESLIVMYNKHDYRKKSKGYGFVKFSTAEEAAEAIKGVDGTRVANKTIKVSIARPGRARRSSNVFVSRLPVNWTDEDLQRAFSEFGHIVESRVLTFGDGVSRRCGFVRYDSDEEAKRAMNSMKNYRPTPRDAPLQVNLSVNHSPDARHQNMEKELALNPRSDPFDFMPPWMGHGDMFNRPMPRGPRYDEDDYMYGGRMGGGMDFAGFMQDPMSNMPFSGKRMPHDTGYFPEDYGSSYGGDYGPRQNSRNSMDHPDTKEFAMQGRQEYTTWNNRNFDSFDYKKSSHKTKTSNPCAGGSASKSEGGTRVFIQNLPEFYEETHLKQLFSSYGEISEVTIQRDRNGKSMQCGFVVFNVSSHANSAHEALDGVMLSTQTLVIHVM